MIKKWNGIDRRSGNGWHELITRIDANLINLIEKTASHLTEDREYQTKTDKTLDNLNKYLWIANGITIASLFFIKLVFKI